MKKDYSYCSLLFVTIWPNIEMHQGNSALSLCEVPFVAEWEQQDIVAGVTGIKRIRRQTDSSESLEFPHQIIVRRAPR